MTTATLTDFLLARIAEDEEAARSATVGPWFVGGDGRSVSASSDEWDDVTESSSNPGPHVVHASFEDNGTANAEHVVQHDPSRVLAECEAKRRILLDISKGDSMDAAEDFKTTPLGAAALLVPMHMATVYADHQDYRNEWRP